MPDEPSPAADPKPETPAPDTRPAALDLVVNAVAKTARQNSGAVMATTATSMSVASGVTVLEWVAALLHVPMPDAVAVAIVAGLAPAAHLLYRFIGAKMSAPEAQKS